MAALPTTSRHTAAEHLAAPWRLCVAPMMEWTDRHCRAFHRVLAPHARVYTEMVHANAVLRGDRARLLGFDRSEKPVALQLGGSEPAALAAAAVLGAELGYDEVNLNVGCPSDRVQAGRFGACLMREPALVAECVGAMSAALSARGLDVPVTVKCRLGVDELDDDALLLAFIDTVAQAGCGTFIVHARKAWLKGLSPKENREIPPLQPARVHRLKRLRPQLSIVLNGGLVELGPSLAELAHVDGIMLGRAAYHDPYLLHRIEHALHGTPLLSRAALLRQLRPYVEAQLRRGLALKHIARHLLGLFHGEPGGRAFRRILTEGTRGAAGDWSLVEDALAATAHAQARAA